MDGSFGLNIVKSRMGPEDERTKIETAMQCTMATVRSALARHECENGQWTTWDNFQKYMKAKYTSTDSGFESENAWRADLRYIAHRIMLKVAFYLMAYS